MATSHKSDVIQHLRRTLFLREAAGMTDSQLLEDYLDRRDQAALSALVRRHAPMVWGVCCRLLYNHHDAEDAFQATFLVLVRKAQSIASRGLLANWLYGVAHQTALKARATLAKRKARERQVTDMPETAVTADFLSDLQPLLDAELSHLPDKYRVVIVLCDLEGIPRKEAARQLGLAEGTVASRTARARVMLAKRLARRGVTLSGGALVALLSTKVAAAAVPTSVVARAIKAASTLAAGQSAAGVISAKVVVLAQGVVRTMLLSKLKTVIIGALMITLPGLGGGVFAWKGQAAENPSRQAAKEMTPTDNDNLKKTLLQLDELWWTGNVETLDRLAADDLITVSTLGRYDKPSLLQASRNRRGVDCARRDIEVSRVSKDVAIVTYRYDCNVVWRDGTPFEHKRDRRLSMTWANRKGRWVVVFVQETTLPGGE